MAAGGPHDHPITDVLFWNIEVYDPVSDRELKQLADLLSRSELYDWWDKEIGWTSDPVQAAKAIHAKLDWANSRASQSGWEMPVNGWGDR